MRPPTADEIEAAKSITANDPVALAAATKPNRPPGLGKRPRGRPRKDGTPPRQSAAAAAKERAAAAAIVHLATNPPNRTSPAAERDRFVPDSIEERIKHLELTRPASRACTFLRKFAENGYRFAANATSATPGEIHGWKQGEEFRRIYDTIQAARDAATVAKTCGTLADLANGEYKPRPDCLPPDTRAASLLLPALDPRFRAGQQGNAQQVQINISI